VVLFVLLISCVFATVEYGFHGNITDSNGDYKYRATKFVEVNLGLFEGVFYASTEGDFSLTTGTASGDGVFGAAYQSVGSPVSSFIAYWDTAASFNVTSVTGGDPTQFDLTGAASLIGSTYVNLTEVDATTGDDLQSIRLGSLTWTLSPAQTSTTDARIHYVVFTGTAPILHPTLTVTFTYLASPVAGVLQGGAIVTPKSIELVIQVNGYPFQGQNSNLVIEGALVTATGNVAANVTKVGDFHRWAAGSGASAVYFDASTTVVVDASGTTKSVNVTERDAVAFEIARIGQLIPAIKKAFAMSNFQVSVKLINFTAPQSSTITFDPTQGAGPAPNPGTSGVGRLSVSLTFLFACLLAVMGLTH